MRQNNIEVYEGQGIFVDRHTIRVKSQDIDTQISFDADDYHHRRHPAAAALRQPRAQGAHLRGTDHVPRAAVVNRHYGRRADRRRIRLFARKLRRRVT